MSFMYPGWGSAQDALCNAKHELASDLCRMFYMYLQVAASLDDSEIDSESAFHDIDSESAFHEIDAALQALPRVTASLAKRASPESKKICPRG